KIGGDWYDAFELRDGRVAISVGDVTGHGLDAATMMVRARETLRAASAAEPDRPDLVLDRANRVLAAGGGAFVTAIVGILDPVGPRFIYSCAGHPSPILRRNSQTRTLRGGGIPLGIAGDLAFAINHVTLKPHDVLLLYTDGLTESTRDVLEGEQRLRDALVRPYVTAHSLVDDVVSGTQSDDVAVLLVRIAPIVEPRTVPTLGIRGWEFSSDDAGSAETARASFTSYLRARGAEEGLILSCEIAFGELVGNVVRHAPGPIEIDLEWCRPRPILRVRDYGRGFDFSEPALPTDLLSEDGRGLYLVEALGGSLNFERQADGGTLVVAELPIDVTSEG
ncbi:MAG: serine/threonine-protein phosphatase, partial [Candidatus Eremiobacteraeota bacterium]|nr:serine/threonine-protein phosphatase [Candidatus Eremiobacteraeota bacterium]